MNIINGFRAWRVKINGEVKMATVNGQNEEVKSLINEAVQKLVKGIVGIEILFDLSLDDFQWTINTQENTYQIYFEKFKKE